MKSWLLKGVSVISGSCKSENCRLALSDIRTGKHLSGCSVLVSFNNLLEINNTFLK